MLRITRADFIDAIEQGITAANAPADAAEHLRLVGRTAKRSVVGGFWGHAVIRGREVECACPALQAGVISPGLTTSRTSCAGSDAGPLVTSTPIPRWVMIFFTRFDYVAGAMLGGTSDDGVAVVEVIDE